jgi:hypothetical protein
MVVADVADASRDVVNPQYRFDVAVDTRGWTLNRYTYFVTVPILGPGTMLQLTTREEGIGGKRVIIATHEGEFAVTTARFEVPPDAVEEAPSVILMDAELTVSIDHVLHAEWQCLVERLIKACNHGDLQGWDSAWDELKTLTLKARSGQCKGSERALVECTTLSADVAARVSAEAVFSEAGWSAGACKMALTRANFAVANGVPGAEAVLDRLLATCDLTTEEVRGMLENGLKVIRNNDEPDDKWILLERDFCGRRLANRSILDRFGIE